MAKAEEENPGKKSIPRHTDEQVIENLIRMRKYQLGALNKIMSSIIQPAEKFSMNPFESIPAHDTSKFKKKSKS